VRITASGLFSKGARRRFSHATLDRMTTREVLDTDGRNLRRMRNREAVLDAVVEIFESGNIDPSIDAVAERAGVSNRSIYRYFDHRDHLVRAAVTHTMRRVVLEMPFEQVGVGSFDERIERFVDHRLMMYQRLAPITRAAKLASVSQPIIAEEFEVGRVMLRQQLLDQFTPEFAHLTPRQQERVLITAGLAFQFDAFEFLWTETKGELDEMRSLLILQLQLALGHLAGL
jgi:TetR/AcrR family transcriptional regulator, regulator of autoinduction and epiphytic fitness